MGHTSAKILICGEDRGTVRFIEDSLGSKSYSFQCYDNVENAMHHISPGDYQAILLGLCRDPETGKLDIFDAIKILRKIDPNLPVIAIACNDSLELEKKARMAGIFYYLTKPLDVQELRMSVNNAINKFRRAMGENQI